MCVYVYIYIHTDVSGGFYATICNVEYSEEADALIVQGVSSEKFGVCVSPQKAEGSNMAVGVS